MDTLIQLAALLIAIFALVVSYRSWHASILSVRASTYDQRYKIYEDAEQYIGSWLQSDQPDMAKLHLIIGAWNRAHFLCGEQVTNYLRKVWVDSVKAAELHDVMSGKLEGNHDQAVKAYHALRREHADYDKLRAVFLPDLKLNTHPMSIWTN